MSCSDQNIPMTLQYSENVVFSFPGREELLEYIINSPIGHEENSAEPKVFGILSSHSTTLLFSLTSVVRKGKGKARMAIGKNKAPNQFSFLIKVLRPLWRFPFPLIL